MVIEITEASSNTSLTSVGTGDDKISSVTSCTEIRKKKKGKLKDKTNFKEPQNLEERMSPLESMGERQFAKQ